MAIKKITPDGSDWHHVFQIVLIPSELAQVEFNLNPTSLHVGGYCRMLMRLLCGMVMHLNLSLHSTRETDGEGFEPPVPYGTHALQACTINHSVTHPERSSFFSES